MAGLLLMCSGFCTFYAISNAILGIICTVLLPLYLSFCGPEAAIRFSLLLIVHALILACVPQILKSSIPMVQLVLLLALLFLPINVTPFLAVWIYEKLLYLAEPVLSIIEALQVVLAINYVSQSLVDEMEDSPTFVKSTILGIAFTSYSLVLWISYGLFTDESTSILEKWILFIVLVASASIIIACVIQEEGIISDAAVVSLMMVCVLWAMKQERIMTTNPFQTPSRWTDSLGGRSFLWVLNSMASSSLTHLGQAQVILRNLLSPTYLLLAFTRVGSVVGCLCVVKNAWLQDQDEVDDDFLETTTITTSTKFWTPKLNSLVVRLVFIFVYTEFLLRSMLISTQRPIHSASNVLPNWILNSLLFELLYQVRVWRIFQLLVTMMTYLYILLYPRES